MSENLYEQARTPDRVMKSMAASRKISLAGGLLYLLTFVSIPTAVLYVSVRAPNYIVGPGPDTAVIFGCILEIIVALAGIGTAVALYPALKRQNEAFALGFMGSRILEASTIFAGVICLMTIVTLRRAGSGSDALVTGRALIAMYNGFHLGQTIMPAMNDFLLGYLLYRSRLVPRILPVMGFIGVPLLVANAIFVMFGISGTALTLTTLGVLPIALFEFLLGVWLTIKGFKPTAITAAIDGEGRNMPVSAK